MLGTTFWQSMKNKMRKAKKNLPDHVPTDDTNCKRVWDLRILFEQEPRMWAACFCTPESFVVLANCVTSQSGVVTADTHVLDMQRQNFPMQPPKLPDLGAAGRVAMRGNRLYISAMDLCRYYWKEKGFGTYDRQMQSWNAGRRAALREKTKSFVHIEDFMGVETEWWDVEGILTSTKVLRNFLVQPEGAEPLSQLAQFIYQCRDFYGNSQSNVSSPARGLFGADDGSLSGSGASGSSPECVPSVRKRTPSMKAEGSAVSGSTIGPNCVSPKRRKRTMSSTPSPPPPSSPIAMRNTLSNISHQSICSPLYDSSPRSPRSPSGQYSRGSPTDTPFQQMIREHIGTPEIKFRGPAFSDARAGSTASAVGLMLLVDAATRDGAERGSLHEKVPNSGNSSALGSPADPCARVSVTTSMGSAFSEVNSSRRPSVLHTTSWTSET